MYALKSKPIAAIVIAVFAALSMSGCGKSNKSNSPNNNGLIWGQGGTGVGGSACLSGTGQELQAGGFSLAFNVTQGMADYANVQATGSVTGGQIGYQQIQMTQGSLGRVINGYASIIINAQVQGGNQQVSYFTGPGVLVLGPTILQDIMMRYGQQVCFGAIQIQTGHSGSTLYGGYVYVQLNNGQAYPIYF